MLWQCHQDTEIVFLKCLWPEFDLWTFLPVLVEWQWRRKTFDNLKERGAGGSRKGFNTNSNKKWAEGEGGLNTELT